MQERLRPRLDPVWTLKALASEVRKRPAPATPSDMPGQPEGPVRPAHGLSVALCVAFRALRRRARAVTAATPRSLLVANPTK